MNENEISMIGSIITILILILPILLIWYFGIRFKKTKLEFAKNEFKKAEEKQKGIIDNLLKEEETLKKNINELQLEINQLKKTVDVELISFYENEYYFEESQEYNERRKDIQEKQKQLIKDDKAYKILTKWAIEGSEKKGEKFSRDIGKLLIRGFNGECDSIISKVKYNNVSQSITNIDKIFEQINKLSKVSNIYLSEDFKRLKIEELKLTFEYQEKKFEEKEEQRRIKEEMREEERVRKEIEKAQQDAIKEELLYAQALEETEKELASAREEERGKYNEKIIKLQEELKLAQERKERALSQAQLTKSGHVYIISNIGSFGENVYKIGMTRRLEPMDRVNELGDASVPFPFDVHAMIYSENAPELETQLHKSFEQLRLNKVNLKKEFFKVDIEDIVRELKKDKIDVKLTKLAEAKEYKETLAIERKKMSYYN